MNVNTKLMPRCIFFFVPSSIFKSTVKTYQLIYVLAHNVLHYQYQHPT